MMLRGSRVTFSSSALLDDLYDILVLQLVVLATALRVVLDAGAPDDRALHLFQKSLVNSVAEVLNRAGLARDNYRCLVVGNLAFGLGVDSNEVEVFPDFLHQLIEIPLVLGTDGHVMGELVK